MCGRQGGQDTHPDETSNKCVAFRSGSVAMFDNVIVLRFTVVFLHQLFVLGERGGVRVETASAEPAVHAPPSHSSHMFHVQYN